MRGAAILLATALAGSTPAPPQIAPDDSGLPVIGKAPGFVLRAQDGAEVALYQFRGKVVAVTFIFASCSATCPILTAKMAAVQDRLGSDFGSKVAFLSITVDPEHDNPEVLKRYATDVRRRPCGLEVPHRFAKFDSGGRTSLRRVRFANTRPRAGPHQPDLTGRSGWHAARAISWRPLRSR